ncbi:hypothetical protein ACSYDW_01370 [Paeniglutamicibacter sp. R2-26]|uniref:hypothetical protein n=1 Tax=Paeniglutamicibacter sp. R2-26 TaxID=3144417 RepID=UPI003EE50D31
MALQPWAIDGAKLSAAQARAQAFKETGGARGITLPGDLKVTALPTPGAAVRVAPGGATLPNDYPGGAGQSYGTLMVSAEDVNVPATGSSGGATSYLIQRIIDPEYGGNLGNEDPLTFRYDPFVLVPSITNLNYPFVPLAKIVQPANTATITQAMITDIREVAKPRRRTEMRVLQLTGVQGAILGNTGAFPDGGQTWPVETEAAWGEIYIPSWATYCKIIMTWAGVGTPQGSAVGFLWVQVGPTANPANFKTQAIKYDTQNAGGWTRQLYRVPDQKYIPAALRGTSQKFYPRGNFISGPTSARLSIDAGSGIDLYVEFMEQAD